MNVEENNVLNLERFNQINANLLNNNKIIKVILKKNKQI